MVGGRPGLVGPVVHPLTGDAPFARFSLRLRLVPCARSSRWARPAAEGVPGPGAPRDAVVGCAARGGLGWGPERWPQPVAWPERQRRVVVVRGTLRRVEDDVRAAVTQDRWDHRAYVAPWSTAPRPSVGARADPAHTGRDDAITVSAGSPPMVSEGIAVRVVSEDAPSLSAGVSRRGNRPRRPQRTSRARGGFRRDGPCCSLPSRPRCGTAVVVTSAPSAPAEAEWTISAHCATGVGAATPSMSG